MISDIDKQIDRVERRLAKLRREFDDLLEVKARAAGWKPCGDCFGDWCSMNCSSVPTYMQVMS